MLGYILQRLILLPITLFAIVLVNFVIINLAPGEPVYVSETRQAGVSVASPEDRYLQFREFFGLTLPLVYNDWPATSKRKMVSQLDLLKIHPEDMSAKRYSELRIEMSDKAR
ncbi:MAG: ABC transporter permease, partial [Verrucomicrobia bacterium]|nr:ABC transporter permease [Verrucomicrobiota bacterium]